MPLRILNQDITALNVDAIVNSTNEDFIGYSGVDEIIHNMGGEDFEKECALLREKGGVYPGQSAYTNAYNLPCKYVIHTISPEWIGGCMGEDAILRSCYRTSLIVAEELHCQSVAFPLLAAGSLGYPVPKALEIAVTTINEYLSVYSDISVFLVLHGHVNKFIAESMYGDLDEYVSERFKPGVPTKKTLEEEIEKPSEELSVMLKRIIKEKGLSDPQVYHRAQIKKNSYNKIINGETKKPSIETMARLAMALSLSYKEACELLASAGMAFSDNSTFDIIVSYFLKNKDYDLYRLDEQLLKYGYQSLFY